MLFGQIIVELMQHILDMLAQLLLEMVFNMLINNFLENPPSPLKDDVLETPDEAIAMLERHDVAEDTIAAMLGGNAARIFGLPSGD